MYIDLAESLTASDKSGNGSTSESSGTTLDTLGQIFDNSNDIVTITASAAADITTSPIYLLLWTYPTSHSGNQWVIAKSSGSIGNTQYGIRLSGTGTTSTMMGVVGGGSGNESGTLALNTWYLIGFVWNGTTVVDYINGSAVGTPTNNSNTVTSKTPFTVGKRTDGYAYASTIGEIWLGTTALSASDVLDFYNLTKARYGL